MPLDPTSHPSAPSRFELTCPDCKRTFYSSESLSRCQQNLSRHQPRCSGVQQSAGPSDRLQHAASSKAQRADQLDCAPLAARRSPEGSASGSPVGASSPEPLLVHGGSASAVGAATPSPTGDARAGAGRSPPLSQAGRASGSALLEDIGQAAQLKAFGITYFGGLLAAQTACQLGQNLPWALAPDGEFGLDDALCAACSVSPAIIAFQDLNDVHDTDDMRRVYCARCAARLQPKVQPRLLMAPKTFAMLRRVLHDNSFPVADVPACTDRPEKRIAFTGAERLVSFEGVLDALKPAALCKLAKATKGREHPAAKAAAAKALAKPRGYGSCNPDWRASGAVPPQIRQCQQRQETEHQLPRRLQRAHLWKLSSLALLLITAGAGSGLRAVHTPLHLDVTEATNVAFGLEGKASDLPVATWVLLAPRILPFLQEAMVNAAGWQPGWLWGDAAEDGRAGQQEHRRITFSAQQRQQLQEQFPDDVVVLQQFAGEEVRVPPGWLHCVSTEVPSVKFAWEVVDPSLLSLYAANLCSIGCRFVDGLNNSDYAKPLRLLQHVFEVVNGDEDD